MHNKTAGSWFQGPAVFAVLYIVRNTPNTFPRITQYGRFILDQGYYDLAVSCCIAGIDEQEIAVKDTGVDHGVSAHPKSETVACGNDLRRNGEVVLNVLLCQDRLPGSNISNDRKRGHFRAHHLETVVTDLDRAGLGGISSDKSVSL